MSGHSKWNNIKNKKEKSDFQRAKVYTKLGRELVIAIKEGGPDPSSNSKLKDVIAKCRANNMPNDNIERSIKKAAGEGSTANYEEITYEGYGPNGVALFIEVMTDNRNRTAGDVRHILDKFGGNLGTNGSVSWMFNKKGVIIIEKTSKVSEESLMMEALEAGAENLEAEEEYFEITTTPENFSKVRDYFDSKKIQYLEAEIKMVPQNYLSLDEEASKKLELIVEKLEELDDVQNVWHNWDEE
jgi:YebC/PmpR family DNA-binding regulatory protein